MKIAIFGGTFNPVHNGHIAIARSIIEGGLADRVWLMVTPCNPWKQDRNLPDNEVRLRMVKAAVSDIPGIEASDFEFGLPLPQYTSSTLKALKAKYPEHEFVLVIGADNWVGFTGWHEWEYIVSTFGIIVYPRDGYNLAGVPSCLNAARVTELDAPLFNVSSTQIRALAAAGESVARYVPAAALDIFLSLDRRFLNGQA